MSGENISAVTPECILEFLVHLQKSSVSELQFIEEAYTSIIFEDDDFMRQYDDIVEPIDDQENDVFKLIGLYQTNTVNSMEGEVNVDFSETRLGIKDYSQPYNNTAMYN